MRGDYKGGQRKLLVVMDRFIILIVVKTLQVHTYVKNCQTEHFKYVLFIVCQLYFHKCYFFKRMHF